MFYSRENISLTQLPDTSPATLRKLSDEDLARFIGGWRVGTAEYINGTAELARRQGLPTIKIAVAALIVSIVALVASLLK
ncbi:MAG: hypothetical protein HOP09_08310 [Hyphomicrobium sp.]|nr:hypothetical protein [Hyphomicrobium sp.]